LAITLQARACFDVYNKLNYRQKKRQLTRINIKIEFIDWEVNFLLTYKFEILNSTPLKGMKIAGSKDYETRVTVEKDHKVIFNEIIKVRKNKEGVFPDLDPIRKISAVSTRKELIEKIKEYFKRVK